MSSEMAKKRGRPKKVIAELLEAELSEVTKQTTRAKSTKAAPKTVKAKAPSTSKKPILKTASLPSAARPASKPVSPVVKAPVGTIGSGKHETRTQDTAINLPKTKPATVSPILGEVQKLKEQQTMASETPKIPLNKPSTPPTNVPSSNSVQPTAPPSKPIPPPSNPTPPKRLPVAALNSAIVSNISTRAGARPNTAGSKQLPQNYKAVSRKVTMAIVAMPVAIVTSYVLYQRLVLGEERKHLVDAEPPVPELAPPSAEPASK